MSCIHASCVELDGVGVLLLGSPGSGKSDLALRLIDAGARLVADDRVVLETLEGRLIAQAPPALAGLIEVRGLGIQRLAFVDAVAVGLVAELVPLEDIERLPERPETTVAGVTLPLVKLWAFEAAAAAKIRLAARTLAARASAQAHGKDCLARE